MSAVVGHHLVPSATLVWHSSKHGSPMLAVPVHVLAHAVLYGGHGSVMDGAGVDGAKGGKQSTERTNPSIPSAAVCELRAEVPVLGDALQ